MKDEELQGLKERGKQLDQEGKQVRKDLEDAFGIVLRGGG